MKGTLERRHAFHVQELDKMEEEKNMLERELDDANRRVDQAERETELAADDKSRVAKECENMIETKHTHHACYADQMQGAHVWGRREMCGV